MLQCQGRVHGGTSGIAVGTAAGNGFFLLLLSFIIIQVDGCQANVRPAPALWSLMDREGRHFRRN